MINLTPEDYKFAEEKFNVFYEEKLRIMNSKKIKYKEPTNIKISTITLTGKIGEYVMGKFFI